jgi:copper(I)-binding protein
VAFGGGVLEPPGRHPGGAASSASEKMRAAGDRNAGRAMTLRPPSRVDVPGGSTAGTRPGSHHIMLVSRRRDLQPGEGVAVDLTFEHGGTLRVEAPVR